MTQSIAQSPAPILPNTAAETLALEAPAAAVAPAKAGGRVSVERLAFPGPVRAYAMSIVVLIHVASVLAPHYNTISPADWWISNAYHAFSKGGPPIFTLVSGMLLLSVPASQPISVFFRKRFVKVLIPFLFWAVVYLAWRIFFLHETLSPYDMVKTLFDGPVYYHLWFIQMILGLYLATPILRIYVQNASRTNLRYFLLVWFVGVTVLPVITHFTQFSIRIDLAVTTAYVGYFVLGYYLRDFSLSRRQLLPCLLIVVATMVMTELGTYWLMINQGGKFNAILLNNLGFNMVIISVGLFLFLKSVPYDALFARLPLLGRAVALLASCSLGVYFVHVLIMELLASGQLGFKLNWLTFGPLIGIPLDAFVVLVLSIAVVWCMQRLPILHWFVP
jgi:surface polysaccharide O-acyltransferase-like enzyme